MTGFEEVTQESEDIRKSVENQHAPEPTRKVRYSGVSGSSVTTDYGHWNINAPDFIGDTTEQHPYAPMKVLPERVAKLVVDDVLFFYDDK